MVKLIDYMGINKVVPLCNLIQ